MPERLVQVDPLTASLAVGSTRNGRELREHDLDSQSMGKGHGRLDGLLIAVWMADDEIRVDLARIRAGAE